MLRRIALVLVLATFACGKHGGGFGGGGGGGHSSFAHASGGGGGGGGHAPSSALASTSHASHGDGIGHTVRKVGEAVLEGLAAGEDDDSAIEAPDADPASTPSVDLCLDCPDVGNCSSCPGPRGSP